jgi:hypothetical protein
MISYVVTAMLAILIAILVLIIRQIVIILLLILAPIAIVASILPNTQKYYKFWWESFSKALLMFPLIAAFIASGRVFAAISIQNGGGINQLIAFIAYFAPYFLIPLTFKFAGGALSSLGGFVNNRGTGLFKGLSNYRSGQMKSRVERARGAGLYRKKTGFTGMLNKVGFYTLNADEQLPYDLGSGKGLGRVTGPVGKRLFGRQAAEMAGQKATSLAEHNGKAVERANLHYGAGYAALGWRDKFHKDMTADGLKAMDNAYGIDEDGRRSSQSGKAAVTWKPPENADFHGLTQYAQMLQDGSEAGSFAASGGKELLEKAGTLSSFGRHMDTQRATLASVAAASVAKDGKMGTRQASRLYNDAIDAAKGDPAAEAMAGALLTQIEAASTNYRPDMRRGKGIMIDKNGRAYSAYDEADSKQAYASATSLKGQAATNAKAETVKEMGPTILSVAQGKHPEHFDGSEEDAATAAKAMQETILYGAANPYSDVDQRSEWDKLANELGITPEQKAAAAEKMRIETERSGGAKVLGAGGAPPVPPPAFPGGGAAIPPPSGV